MHILLAYATYSSGTATASELVEHQLAQAGLAVTRKEIRAVKPDDLAAFDCIILGSPSWKNNDQEGQPHEFFLDFMATMAGKTLPGKQFAIFGLGDSSYMT